MAVKKILLCCSLLILGVFTQRFPFNDPSLPWDVRVDDIVVRLNLTELMQEMAKGGAGAKGGPSPAIPRLGIGPYQFNEECLRGVFDAGKATAFPQALGLAAAFSPKLIHDVSSATGAEVRAKHNDYVRKKEYGDHRGLSCFAPVINIMRHPLWGRNQETYGEDPYLSGVYAANFVQGLQGDHPRYAQASAGCKHFDAYGGPENIPSSRLSFNAEETYGEDPFLSGVYAYHYVKGLQGKHLRYIMANAGCKHFDVHGGPENVPVSRFSFDSKVSDRDWRLTFLPAFRSCVRAGTFSIMCSYNSFSEQYMLKVSDRDWHLTFLPSFRQCVGAGSYSLMCSFNKINGVPACANKKLLTDILRDTWKFRGYVISDEEAVENLVLFHHYANTSMEATIDVLKAGLNIELTTSRKNPYFFTIACANPTLLTDILRREWNFRGYVVSDMGALEFAIETHKYFNNTVDTAAACVKAGCNLELVGGEPIGIVYQHIEEAVKQGKLSEDLVRERVKPLFYTRMRLGEFDPAEMNPYLQYNLSLVQSPQHQELAVKAAMQTFVLLKNANNRLPLPKDKKFKKIAIVGPMADNLEQLYGDYAPDMDAKFAQTPLQGLQGLADNVGYAAGCTDNKCQNYTNADIKTAMLDAQMVIICVGTGQEIESEGNDRYTMDLPGNQTQLIKDTLFLSQDKAVILLVFSAGPVNISFADRDRCVEAIIQCFFPAQATGKALFNTLTMATMDASPAGRLPYTWYDTADQVPSMTDYSMVGRTYRYFQGKPLYPFGYGLSYSAFQYEKVYAPASIVAGDDQYVNGLVANIGTFDAYEVVQVYISWASTKEVMPQRQLAAFDRMFIKAGGTRMFEFVIKAEQLAVWTDSGYKIQPGKMLMFVGGQQPDQARSVGSNVLTTSFEITGDEYHMGKF